MYVIIVNPISGNGRTLKTWVKVEQMLKDKQISYQVEFTKWKGHAQEIVSQLDPSEVKTVIVIGGDGTVHEAINGLKLLNIPLGIIPAGSGNDYARSMNIPKDPKEAFLRILTGQKKKIDNLSVNGQYCVTVVGIGFDGKVAETSTHSSMKKILNQYNLGKFVYAYFVLKVLAGFKTTNVTILLDGKGYTFENAWLVTVANMPYCGGGMKICPDAKNDDGLFDVCIMHGTTSRLKLLSVFPKVFRGNHVYSPLVSILKGSAIQVTTDRPSVIHGDGEIIGNTPIEITIAPKTIEVV